MDGIGNTSGPLLLIGMDGYRHFVKIKRLVPSDLMNADCFEVKRQKDNLESIRFDYEEGD